MEDYSFSFSLFSPLPLSPWVFLHRDSLRSGFILLFSLLLLMRTTQFLNILTQYSEQYSHGNYSQQLRILFCCSLFFNLKSMRIAKNSKDQKSTATPLRCQFPFSLLVSRVNDLNSVSCSANGNTLDQHTYTVTLSY